MGNIFQKIHHLKKWKKILLIWLIIMACIGGGLSWRLYQNFFRSNINKSLLKPESIYIPTGSKYNDVLKILDKNHLLINRTTFLWLAKQLDYPDHIKPGKYKIEPNMSNFKLIKMLRSGAQTPVHLVVGKYRLNHQFRVFVAKNLEPDSIALQNSFDTVFANLKIDTTDHFKDMTGYVIPNTYEFWWNVSPSKFWRTILSEYKKFWNPNRKLLAQQLGLTPYQVTILASIVDEETAMDDEKPTIAGVYINRFRKNISLQADPTVRFALHDFTIKRILFGHLKTESPYNTYKIKGLPPGPICIPSTTSIDAVLNAEQHEFMFFCAKEDFSGYHNFAKTFEEHQANAKKYQKAFVDRFILHKFDSTQNKIIDSLKNKKAN